jgi:hypothetical protein
MRGLRPEQERGRGNARIGPRAAECERRIHGDDSHGARRIESEEHSMTKESRWLALLVAVAVAPALQADSKTEMAPTPAATHAAQTVMVPAGTVLNVHLSEAIDVDVTQAGATFKGRVDDPIIIDGRVVIPRGAAAAIRVVSIRQSGTLKGSDQIALKLNSISFGDHVYEVVTKYAVAKGKGEGKRTARKVGAGAGLGAIIGAIADGGDGAAIGAVVGGITGTIVAASGEEHLKLPAESLLQFELTAAVRVEP